MLSDGNGMPVKDMIFRFSDSHIEENKDTGEILLILFNFSKSKNIPMCKKRFKITALFDGGTSVSALHSECVSIAHVTADGHIGQASSRPRSRSSESYLIHRRSV